MVVNVVVFESQNPVTPKKRFCAFLIQEVDEIGEDRKKTGRKVFDNLPMVFWSDSADGAENKARHFWITETARSRDKRERGKKLGNAAKAKGKTPDV